MMRSVSKLLVVVALVLLPGAGLCDEGPLDAGRFQGTWESVKLEGKDIGTRIASIRATFENDGHWVIVAKIRNDGNLKTETKKGTYRVDKDQFVMTMGDETVRMKAWFKDGRLVIQDPKLDSRIHYQRVKQREKWPH